ncbi:hypothetical protein [Novipirellula artificiosorum]|uniref:hypothetical protein n=1 Tax=Novipirellula artificiosorum TaxID=2528016 RepID=UPI0011B694C7|nr:hypothetical protein [Novipirellula artificiosorum]
MNRKRILGELGKDRTEGQTGEHQRLVVTPLRISTQASPNPQSKRNRTAGAKWADVAIRADDPIHGE